MPDAETVNTVLHGLSLSNFGCLGSMRPLVFRFEKPLNVITGNNGTGKTTIAQAIRGLTSVSEDPSALGVSKRKAYAGPGKERAVAEAFWDDDESRTQWIVGDGILHEGDTVKVSGLVTGMNNPVALTKPISAQKFWDQIFKVQMNKDQVSYALIKSFENLPNEMYEELKEIAVKALAEIIPDKGRIDWDRVSYQASSYESNLRGAIIEALPDEAGSGRKKAMTLHAVASSAECTEEISVPELVSEVKQLQDELSAAEAGGKALVLEDEYKKTLAELDLVKEEIDSEKLETELNDIKKIRDDLIGQSAVLEAQMGALPKSKDV